MSAALLAVFVVPFAAGTAAFLAGSRLQLFLGLGGAAATSAAAGLLALVVLHGGAQEYHMGGWMPPLGIRLRCDGLSLLMVLLTATVCLFTSAYAAFYFDSRDGGRSARLFWPLWLLLWAGLNCVFVCGDVFTLYLLLEFTLLAAVALAALEGSIPALVAALRYLLAATAAALFYLLGVVLLYSEYNTLDLRALAAEAPAGYLPLLALGLMTGGLALKSALFPLHFWLPPAHATAPAPVSAVLSGLVVKAAFYVMMRLQMEVFPGTAPEAGKQVFALLGTVAVLWGSWRALRQVRLKMLIAYSTVAQMGYLFLVFPLIGRASGTEAAMVYQILSHGVAKAAMFLGAGGLAKAVAGESLAQSRGGFRHAPLSVLAIVLSGAVLAGVGPGGGTKGKILGLVWDEGQWWWALVVAAGMVLTAAYTFAAVRHSFLRSENGAALPANRALGTIALALALLAVIASFFSEQLLSVLAHDGGGK